MALFLQDIESNRLIISELEFDKNESVFILRSEDRSKEFFVEYIPKIDDEFDADDFQLYFFSNQYLNAENDVFQVIDKDLDKRIGWIFPINVLESNDNDYSDNEFLNKYKYVTYKKLLSHSQTKIPSIQATNNFRLTDFYHSDIIVFAISVKTLEANSEFNIIDYLPSFANFGYYQWDQEYHHSYESQRKITLAYKGKSKIHIQKAKLSITNNKFLSDLYCKHLKSINHFLLKFHFLYQVIEFLMEENFNHEFDNLLLLYKKRVVVKNDLREQINNLSKERGNINSILTKVNINQGLITNLKRDCKLLLDAFNTQNRDHIADYIYDTRNLVVHRYREILNKDEHVQLLDSITHQLELVINNLIINYSPSTAQLVTEE